MRVGGMLHVVRRTQRSIISTPTQLASRPDRKSRKQPSVQPLQAAAVASALLGEAAREASPRRTRTRTEAHHTTLYGLTVLPCVPSSHLEPKKLKLPTPLLAHCQPLIFPSGKPAVRPPLPPRSVHCCGRLGYDSLPALRRISISAAHAHRAAVLLPRAGACGAR